MTLKQIEYFVCVVENGSLSKSSELLNISQPPLSAQIKALEDELNAKLFTRSKNGMIVTDKGRMFYHRATEILSLVDIAKQEVSSPDSKEVLRIKIGTVSSVAIRILPVKIYEYKISHPNVDILVGESSTPKILEQIDTDEIDVGIVREPFNTSQYNIASLYDEQLHALNCEDCFVALGASDFFDKKYSKTDIPLSSLNKTPLLSHIRYAATIKEYCKREGFSPNIIFQVDNVNTLLKWASLDSGVAVLPYSSSTLNTDPHLVRKVITQPTMLSRIYLAWKKSRTLSPDVSNFVAHLANNPLTSSRLHLT